MKRSSVFVTAVLAVGLLVCACPAHAAFPGNGGKIAFVARGTNNSSDIYTVNPDGSGQTNLTQSPGGESLPTWSADGKKIAFVRANQILVMNADGSGQAVVTEVTSGFFPAVNGVAWSPDGSRLAFISEVCDTTGLDCTDSLETIYTSGIGRTTLATGGRFMSGPSWTTDGAWIVFESNSLDPDGTEAIWKIRPDGTGLTKVFVDTVGAVFGDPDVSPDGSKIVFQYATGPNYDYQIARVNADGTGFQTLTSPSSSDDDETPVWSPDGSKIAFTSFDSSTGAGTVKVINSSDGSGESSVVNGGTPDWQPSQVPQPGPGYARPKGATPFQTYLTVAYKQCTVSNTNRTHGGPLDVLACNPPRPESMLLTVGTLDANGQQAKAVGVYRLDVQSSPADVKMTFALKDVRNQSDLSDYTGELRVGQPWRITDKNNGPISGGAGTDPATNQDLAFPFDVTCAATADETIGSTCDSVSSANAVVPGSIQPGMRMNTQLLDQVLVQDGGSDGVAATTADNTVFMDQGIFVP